MEWLERMNQCIDYLEDHLEERLDLEALAKELYTSKFHLQRLFHMVTGFTVSEYVRNRKLTLAAQMITTQHKKVIEVAYKYGYDSPESFSRAFRNLHGVSPTGAKNGKSILKAYPKMSFTIQLKGESNMDYKLVEKEAFEIIGKGLRTTTKDGKNFINIPNFWDECMNNGDFYRIRKLNNSEPTLGVCMDFNSELDEFSYYIAVKKKDDIPQSSFEVKTIPASTWAVFESIGPMPSAIQSVINRIFTEWFPATGYEHAGGPEIEVYYEGDTSSDDYKCEVWVPVIKTKTK